MTLSTQLSNSGWIILFNIADDDVREVFGRVDDQGEFRSLGFTPSVDPRTGRPPPVTFLNLSAEAAATDQHRVSVKWVTGNGQTRGPYDLTVSLLGEIVKTTKYVLETLVPNSWISFREYPEGHLLVYFTTLLSSRNAFREIRYSIDDQSVSRIFPFKPWKNLASTPDLRDVNPYMELPFKTRFMAVQLQYLDGTESEIRTFRVDIGR